MAAINTNKVLVSGFVAGVVLLALDFIANLYVVGERFKPEWDAINPALWTNMMSGKSMVTFVILDLILGVLIVWTYAAIRPRFGPGPKTAAYASLLLAAIASLMYFGMMQSGLFSMAAFVVYAAILVVAFLAAGYVGARLYAEA